MTIKLSIIYHFMQNFGLKPNLIGEVRSSWYSV